MGAGKTMAALRVTHQLLFANDDIAIFLRHPIHVDFFFLLKSANSIFFLAKYSIYIIIYIFCLRDRYFFSLPPVHTDKYL